ncbi:MAG: sulfotransferase domain-containing protein [Acidobacteriota bacterium]
MTHRPSPSAGRLPEFLVIGAMKSGTTSLDRYLRSHPRIAMPMRDVDFFSRHYERGLDWYTARWPTRDEPTTVRGETSVSYTMYPHFDRVPERIHRHVPAAKLIYVVRHPIERIVSHYLHKIYANEERRSFERVLAEERDDGPYLALSRYGLQLERYLDVFDRAQILVVPVDRLRALDQRFTTLQEIFAFLGVERTSDPQAFARVEHRTSQKGIKPGWARRLAQLPLYGALARRTPRRLRELYARTVSRPVAAPQLDDAARTRLTARLAPDVARLDQLTGQSFAALWGL